MRERHSTVVAAPAAVIYQTLRTVDFAESRVLRFLLALRALPHAVSPRSGRAHPVRPITLTLDTFLAGFVTLLVEEPPREIVLGLAGPFWDPFCELRRVTTADFAAGPPPGSALAAWSFSITPLSDSRAVVETETRVLTGDASSRRKFRAYWVIVRPFSGLLRRIMLRTIRRAAEHRTSRTWT